MRRTRLATGIYRDRYGISVVVRGKEERYPIGTPLETLVADRKLRVRQLPDARTQRGTLAADVAAYLLTLPAGRRREAARSLLGHWLEAGFGTRHRHSLTAVELAQQLAAWSTRFAAGTLRHLRRELGALYRALDGRGGANPVRDVPAIRVRYDEPRAIPYPLVRAILEALPDRGRPTGEGKGTRPRVSLTKLRLMVMAYTGLTPAMLGQVQARDLDVAGATVFIRPRRKGRGVAGRRKALAPQAVEAFRALAAAGGLGPFSTRSVAKSWNRAVQKVRAAWEEEHAPDGSAWPLPDDVRPYDLRHSYGTALMRRTRDVKAVADALMHATLAMTPRYLQALVTEQDRAHTDALAADLGDLPRSTSMTLPRRPVKIAEKGRKGPAKTPVGATRTRTPDGAKIARKR